MDALLSTQVPGATFSDDAVDALARSLVQKLLHEPTVRLKDAAGSARGALYADALVELFGLPEPDTDTEG